ncbi:histidine phosphatase superfamily [Corynascus novoguineensis]|uniref:Histidine phosphatase superfamily n=1 Tax=Corynascus novoguineensis TaxID=1126955 RepID=A0AAN7CWW6_9PEZI|nr:histidine phosphatase superfamily [Corynascus novoguineensis]
MATSLFTTLSLLVSTALARPDNERLHVESSTDRYSSASAFAFVQGLYPPVPHVTCDSDIPSYQWLSNGSLLNYPLFGYQYPNVRTLAPGRDPDSIWYCNGVFFDAFPRSQANFYSAHELYDYAAYRWNHERGTALAMTWHDLETLRELAWQEQSLKYGHLDNTQNDLASAIAGRTLASRVLALFLENIKSRGKRNKLNVAFTSHEPFLGFFALANLTTGTSSHLFTRLPEPGATLTFELFSINEPADSYPADSFNNAHAYDTDSSDPLNDQPTANDQHAVHRDSNVIDNAETSYPETDRLYVRFLYHNPNKHNHRNASNSPRPVFNPCPLFGNTHSAIPFKQFNATVSAVGISDVASWCTTCGSGDTIFFCKGAEPRTEQQSHHILAALAGSAGTLLAVSFIGFFV